MSTHLANRMYAVFGGSMLMAAMLSPLGRSVYGHEIQPIPIPRNANVFIDPIDGFGPELQKALLDNNVPLVIVSDKGSADFEITGDIRNATKPTEYKDANPGAREELVDSQKPATNIVRVRIVNLRSTNMAWGYGMAGFPDLPSAAGACAKRLKREMKRSR